MILQKRKMVQREQVRKLTARMRQEVGPWTDKQIGSALGASGSTSQSSPSAPLAGSARRTKS